MQYGVDLSYANGTIDWEQAAKDERVSFAGLRVCYGDIPADDDGPVFRYNHDQAKTYGIPTFCYMFFLANHDGALQAEHFLQQADGRYGEWWPVIDVEEGSFIYGSGGSLMALIDNLAKCLNTVGKAIGRPVIYTNPDTWQTYFDNTDAFSGHGLFLADYSVTPGSAKPIPGLPLLWMHQFSDGSGYAAIPGISKPDNNADRDVLMVDPKHMVRT